MRLSEQAALIMATNPLCSARHCGRPADETVLLAGKEVPYCRDHAWYWRAYEQDRETYNRFNAEAKNEKK